MLILDSLEFLVYDFCFLIFFKLLSPDLTKLFVILVQFLILHMCLLFFCLPQLNLRHKIFI